MSPGRTRMASLSSPQASRAWSTAWPVPRRSRCSTKVASASRPTAARTSSAPRPTTTITRAPRARAGIDRIVDERPAAELVKRLGAPGAHAGRLAGGENDGSELVHGARTSSTRHASACPSPTCPEWRALRSMPGTRSTRADCEDETGSPQFCWEEETKTRSALPSPGWTKASPAAWSATPPSSETRRSRSGSAWRARARPAIGLVAEERMADRRQVDPNLVGAARSRAGTRRRRSRRSARAPGTGSPRACPSRAAPRPCARASAGRARSADRSRRAGARGSPWTRQR